MLNAMQRDASLDLAEPMRPWRRAIVWAGIVLFFLVMAVMQTWPLLLHAGDGLLTWPHRPEDGYAYLWMLWWVNDALTAGQNPLSTDYLFYPQGLEFLAPALTTINGVMSIPLQLITGDVILSWNILLIILFVLSGLATYALAYRVTANRIASLVAGYIFTFSPFVMMRLHGHWSISTVWLLPLFALFLVRFQETGRLREAVFAGAVWSLISYNNLEFGSDAGIFMGLFFGYWSIAYLTKNDRGKRLVRLWRGVPVVVIVWLGLTLPVLLVAYDSIQNDKISSPPATDAQSTDPLALVTPSPLWGSGKLPVFPLPPGIKHFPPGDIENTVYLGITPLFLAGVAVVSIRGLRDKPVFWLAVFLAFTILAFGPHLFIDDTKEFSLFGFKFSIPLPYQIYDRMPLIGERRGISRLIAFGNLGLAVLAAIGTKIILEWSSRWLSQRGPRFLKAVPALGAVLLCLIVFEYWNPPNAVLDFESPQAVKAISEERGDFAVLDAPLGRSSWTLAGTQGGALLAMYYGTIHGKPIVGGYTARAPNSTIFWINQPPGIRYLACPNCPGLPAPEDLDATAVRAFLTEQRIRYVVLHRITPHGWQVGGVEIDALDSYLRNTLGLVETGRDDRLTVFRNDAVTPVAARASP